MEKDDLLIAMSGATVGKVAMVKETNLPALMNQRVGKFNKRPYSLGWNSIFLYSMAQSHRFQTFISIESMGGAQPNVSGHEIELYRIAWPAETEQDKIADYLLNADAVISSAHEELRKLLSLKSGLQDDLLTGRVRVPETIMEGAESA
jgi:type I restriction enzyme, S subunit